MTSRSAKAQPARRLWQKPLNWLLATAVVIVAFVGWLAIREVRADQAIRAEITRLRSAGLPVDNATMAAQFAESTHPEGTQAWAEILDLCSSSWLSSIGSTEGFPYVSNGQVPAQINAGENWELQEEVDAYLEIVSPVLSRIHEAGQYPKPVWQPITFNGFSTLLEPVQISRSANQLLQLDAEAALHKQDAARTLQNIESMFHLTDAFDWNNFGVTKLVAIAKRHGAHEIIRRSLSADCWTTEDLKKLRSFVATPESLSLAWPLIVNSERAMLLTNIRDRPLVDASYDDQLPPYLLTWLPSVQLELLQKSEGWENLATNSLSQMRRDATRIGSAQEASGSIIGKFYDNVMTGYPSFVSALLRQEDGRRFTLCALAVKQFQLENDAWPKLLSELESVGLAPSDWRTLEAGEFGFEVENDVAYIWSYYPKKESTVPAQRPVVEENERTLGGSTNLRLVVITGG